MKSKILDELSIYLLRRGYTIKTLTRTCFHLFARRHGHILLLHVLEDANAITKETSDEMQNIAAYTSGSPLIIAEKAGSILKDGVVYMRFGIFTLNLRTFKDAVDQKLPFVFSGKAGLTSLIRGDILKKKREEQGLSLAGLSRKLGVSSRMVAKYESGRAEVTLNRTFKLYDIFGGDIFNKIHVFDYKIQIEPGTSDVSTKYHDLGFTASETKKAPFDVIARKSDELILTEVGDKKLSQLNSISRLIDADKLVIYKKKKPKNIASMTKKEFMEFEKAAELIKFLKEH